METQTLPLSMFVKNFVQQENTTEIKKHFKTINSFEEILEEIRKSFSKSTREKLAIERAKELIELEKDLYTLLGIRQQLCREEWLKSIQQYSETHWEKTWIKNTEKNPEENIAFLQKIEMVENLPFFARSLVRR